MKVKSAWKCRNPKCGHEHLVEPNEGLTRCERCSMGDPIYMGGRFDYSDEDRVIAKGGSEIKGVLAGRKKVK